MCNRHGSGMFVSLNEEKMDNGVVKTSDPDKFVQLTIKSSDMLLGKWFKSNFYLGSLVLRVS